MCNSVIYCANMSASSKRRLEDPDEPRSSKKARTSNENTRVVHQDTTTSETKALRAFRYTGENITCDQVLSERNNDMIYNDMISRISNESRLSKDDSGIENGHDLQSFKCSKCYSEFPFESHLKRHMIVHITFDDVPDTNSNQNPSKVCDESSSNKNATEIENGLDLHRYKCPTCDRGFPFKSHVKRHRVVHKVRRRPKQCSVCSRMFMQQDDSSITRSRRASKDPAWGECCIQTMRKYVFQRSMMKNQSLKSPKA
ncbi:unnamed protein product [Meganyctiphanes norvegica]|uniref:C2H2-type domain-containing protein n=1 Tax=Meganyctiphanes norvegica TaxID=48144 RepID=A0AAV2QUF5_MEGNR